MIPNSECSTQRQSFKRVGGFGIKAALNLNGNFLGAAGAAIIVVVVIVMRNLNPAEYILHEVYFLRDTMTLRLEIP